MHPSIRKTILLLLALAALALIGSCNTSDPEADQYLTWNLNDAYKAYDSVSIKLVDAKDTSLVYEVVWGGKIPDPAHFPKYKLTVAKDKDFTIRIRCFNAERELVLAKDVPVVGTKSQPTVLLVPDVRLLGLSVAPGGLTPEFDPNHGAYAVQVGDSIASITVTATPIDAGDVLTIDQKVCAWGLGNPLELPTGAKVFDVTVLSKDGKVSKNYELTVTRGRVPLPEEVTGLTLKDKSLTLYTGDGPTSDQATVVPAGAVLRWTSLDEAIVRVDGSGRLNPVAPGTAKVVVAAGAFADTATVTVKKDAPVLDAGPNRSVKVGGELTFNLTLGQEHGTLVSFKYDLGGDGAWDNLSDTANAPPSQTLKHTYAVAGVFTAHFYAKDGEGNATTVTVTVRVSNSPTLVTILSPHADTVVNTSPIPFKYDVNGNVHTESRTLTEGANTLSVDSGDGASVKVTLDTQPPTAPTVASTTPTGTAPKWSWTPGGGGIGAYRIKVGDTAWAGVAETRDITYTLLETPVSGKTYTLYVAERDSAGNWSPAAGKDVVFDNSKPTVAIFAPQASGTYITKNATVAFSGTAGGPNAIVKVSYKINAVAAADAVLNNGTWSIAGIPALEATATLVTIVATDNLGHTGEASLTVIRDATPPSAPILTASPATPTNLTTGSWAWSAGSDGTTGSGLNGNYQYSFDGGTTWKATTGTKLDNLPLAEGNNTLSVQEQDKAGNWSVSAAKLVVADRKIPGVKITSHVSPATSGTTRITLSGTVTDSGSGVQSVAITGQQSGSGAATVTGGTWAGTELVLAGGANTLTVTATDKAGNPGIATLAVTVTVGTPTVTITTPAPNTLTNKDTLTVKYKSNNKDTTKLFNLTEGSNTLTVYSPPNELGVAGSASVVVIKDAAPPNAPTVTAEKAVTNADPTWNFTSGGDNTGGSGVAAIWYYKITDKTTGAVITTGTVTTPTFTYAGAADAGYNFVVQQQDKAGNWGAYSSVSSVTVDKTPPSVAITYPSDGYITNKASLTVNYTDAGAAKSMPVTLGNDNGVPNIITVNSAPDGAGNIGTKTITLYLRSNVKFVKPGGNGLGTSWADAYGAIQPALTASASGGQVWVMGGAGASYPSDATAAGYVIGSGVSLYGSFKGTENSVDQRVFNAATTTILTNTSGTTVTFSRVTNARVDGFQIEYSKGDGIDVSNSSGIAIDNSNVMHKLDTGGALYSDNSSFTCTNTKFTNHGFEAAAIYGGGPSASFINCEFSSNTFGVSYAKLVDVSFDNLTFTGTHFKDVHTYPENRDIIDEKVGGNITISGCFFTVANLADALDNQTFNTVSSPVPNTFNSP